MSPARSWFARLLVLALLSVTMAWWLGPKLHDAKSFALEVRMQSSVSAALQVYYDLGAGLSEEASTRTRIFAEPQATAVRLALPEGTFRGLRLDPLDRPGTVTIEAVRIVTESGGLIREIPLGEVKPARHIARATLGKNGLEIATLPEGNDAQLVIIFSPPLLLTTARGAIMARIASHAALIFLGGCTLLFTFAFRPPAALEPERKPSIEAMRAGPAAGLVFALFLTVWGAKLVVIDRFGSDVPYWDQWPRESLLTFVPFFERGELWSHVFEAHNEHRMTPTLLTNLGLVVLGGQWDARVQLVVNAALHALIATGLLLWALRHLPRGWALATAGLLALVFAPPIASENLLSGFQSVFYFIGGFSLLAIGGLLSAAFSVWWWVGLVAAFCALVSLGSGLLAPGVVVAFAFLRLTRNAERRGAIPTLIVAVAVTAIGVWILPSAASHQDYHAQGIGSWLAFAARLLAWPLREKPLFVFIAWLPWIGFFAQRVFRWREENGAADFVCAGGTWVLLQAAAIAYARAGGSTLPPTRYGDITALGLVFAFWAVALLARQSPRPRLRWMAAVWLVAVTSALVVATREVWRGDLRSKKEENAAYERNVQEFVLTDDATALGDGRTLPFFDVDWLAQALRNPTVRARLPASIREPIRVAGIEGTVTPPAPMLAHRRTRVLAQRGEWRTGVLPTSDGWWKMEIAGALGEPGTALEIVSVATGRTLGSVAPTKRAGNSWRAAYVRAPREPAVLLARTDAAERWFAFTAPVGMSNVSHLAWQLAKHGAWIAGAGVAMMFGLMFALRSKRPTA